jgi:hypothetical protein
MIDCVVREGHEITAISRTLVWRFQNCTRKRKLQLHELVDIISMNSPSFSAANFFYVQKSTILGMLNNVVSFAIITIQFELLKYNYY